MTSSLVESLPWYTYQQCCLDCFPVLAYSYHNDSVAGQSRVRTINKTAKFNVRPRPLREERDRPSVPAALSLLRPSSVWDRQNNSHSPKTIEPCDWAESQATSGSALLQRPRSRLGDTGICCTWPLCCTDDVIARGSGRWAASAALLPAAAAAARRGRCMVPIRSVAAMTTFTDKHEALTRWLAGSLGSRRNVLYEMWVTMWVSLSHYWQHTRNYVFCWRGISTRRSWSLHEVAAVDCRRTHICRSVGR